jgi:hypothetical protein
MLLKVMVAVRQRWLQRMANSELQEPAGMCTGSVDALTESGVGIGEFAIAKVKEAGKAEENDMNRVELQRILGYLNIGLAIAHDSGVSIGHFECGDFIQLAQTVNGMLLHSIAPVVVADPDSTAGDGTSTAGAGAALPV